eukprot:m.604350 g.604350  ORF g.604350 m.604350 type:complete len:973 (-) comp58106_c0_seq12:41-2959(-)
MSGLFTCNALLLAAVCWGLSAAIDQRHICIPTYGVDGPVRTGGIASFTLALASMLTGPHRVTVLYLESTVESGTLQDWLALLEDRYAPAKFVALHSASSVYENLQLGQEAATSYRVLEWLLAQDAAGNACNAVVFHDWRGAAHFTVLHKANQLAFQNTTLLVGLHSPTLWSAIGMNHLVTSIRDVQTDFLERESARLADIVFSPSQYMLDWIGRFGWSTQKSVVLLNPLAPHVLAARESIPKDLRQNAPLPIQELIFFGRLEERKGLRLFIEAVNALALSHPSLLTNVTITYLGKAITNAADGASSVNFIKDSLRATAAYQIISNLSQVECLRDYLLPRRSTSLIVIPSLIDNSPYTVVECLHFGLPFIASNVGGIPELLHSSSHANILFDATKTGLTHKLFHVLSHQEQYREQHLSSIMTATSEEVHSQWMQFVDSWWSSVPSKTQDFIPSNQDFRLASNVFSQPDVTVCIATRNRDDLLHQAVHSLRLQEFHPSRLQVVIVDDVSSELPAQLAVLALESTLASWFHSSSVVAYNTHRRADSGTRNACAEFAQSEFLVFLDSDNYAKPQMISTFLLTILRTNFDIVTCALDEFRNLTQPTHDAPASSRWVPLGADETLGLFSNVYGDTTMIVSLSVFRSLRGFSEQHDVGYTDWEFLARAHSLGFKLASISQPLLWYRKHTQERISSSTSSVRNRLRAAGPAFKKAVSQGLKLSPIALLFAQQAYLQQQQPQSMRTVQPHSTILPSGRECCRFLLDSSMDSFSSPGSRWRFGWVVANLSTPITSFVVDDIVPMFGFDATTQHWIASALPHTRNQLSCHASFSGWLAARRKSSPVVAKRGQCTVLPPFSIPEHFYQGRDNFHPATSDSLALWVVRSWEGAASGVVELEIHLNLFPWTCGKSDGVQFAVFRSHSNQGAEMIFMQKLHGSACEDHAFTVRVDLRPDDILHFVAASGPTDYYDGTLFHVDLFVVE